MEESSLSEFVVRFGMENASNLLIDVQHSNQMKFKRAYFLIEI